MPTYSYKCQCSKNYTKCECSKTKEVVHRMTESPRVKCDCGGDMRKIITSASAPVLKGDWFKEGY